MRLSEWAKSIGMSRLAAYRMFKAGTLPVKSQQMPTGRIYVFPEPVREQTVCIYARVSSADQKADLDRQVARLSEHAAQNHMVVSEVVRETGSGLNGNRKKLERVLRKTDSHLLVEHRDRLCRFGFDYLAAALAQDGREIYVTDSQEVADDIVRDLHEVIVSLCARLYGKRAAKNRAQRALEAAQND